MSLDARSLPSAAGLPKRIAGRFAQRPHHYYVRVKLALDPLYRAAAATFQDQPGPILDIGCGLGLLACYLRECGLANPILGIDNDQAKVAAAEAAARGYAEVRFQLQAVDAALPPFRGHVVLFDVLQYLPPAAQLPLLREAAARLAPDGLLLMRSGLREPGWRFRLTLMAERLALLVRWLPPPTIFPTRAELTSMFHAAGLEPEFRPLWGRTPFNNYLVLGRPAASSRSAGGSTQR